jgi:cbb3-type cytochrome oxidase subunit 1
MINGKMTMSGEFGRIRVVTIVTYMKVLHLLHLYDKRTEK